MKSERGGAGRLCCLVLALLAACSGSRAESRPAEARLAAVVVDSARPWREPEDRIDSILPVAEYLRRFRAGLKEPAGFTGGAESREALARRVLEAVGRRDTAALTGLLITRAEFAWLVFPAHRYARPPYELDPALFWFQLAGSSAEGLSWALHRYGGQRLVLRGLWCEPDTLQFAAGGAVSGWSACRVRFGADSQVITRSLFGTIVERDGRAKLLSYAAPD